MKTSRPQRGQHRDQHNVHQRTGERNDQFLPRIVRHPLQPRHAANGQERNVRRANAEAARGQRVAELVQQHAAEKRQQEHHAPRRRRRAAELVVAEPDPGQEQQECEVQPDFNAGDASNCNGPFHNQFRF